MRATEKAAEMLHSGSRLGVGSQRTLSSWQRGVSIRRQNAVEKIKNFRASSSQRRPVCDLDAVQKGQTETGHYGADIVARQVASTHSWFQESRPF